MQYRELRADIEQFCGNSDDGFLASINRFINLAEARIGMLISLPAYTQEADLALGGGSPITSLVALDDFISVNEISLDGYGILQQKDSSFIKEAYPDSTEQGPPRFFAQLKDKTILWGPTPDISYSASMEYMGVWPSLVDIGTGAGDQTAETFISRTFPGALLSGCLYYANMYMKDLETANAFLADMMASLGLVTKFGKGKAKVDVAENTNAANDSGNAD